MGTTTEQNPDRQLRSDTSASISMDQDQGLTSDQIKRYSRAFHRFDTDTDGNIKGKELGKILRYIGHNPTEAEVQEMIATADKDGTGTLDLIEFLQMMKFMGEPVTQEEIDDILDEADKDQNGLIDYKE